METPPSPHKRTFLARVFISPDERRLRAGWRLLVQGLLMLPIAICVTIPILFASELLYVIEELAFIQLIGFVTITVSIILARRFIDRRPFANLGIRFNTQALIDLLAGLLIAFLMIGLIYLVMYALGWVRTGQAGQNWNAASAGYVFTWLFIFILTGWNEELYSRGYQMQNLAEGLNMPWAVIISSAFFGVLHLANPNASAFAAFNIFLAGLFFAFSYLRTKSLWLPIGIHIGWNFTLGVVFGFPVSGIETHGLISPTITGPDVWTGGAFGPEAGLILWPVLLFGVLLVYGYTHRDIYPLSPPEPVE